MAMHAQESITLSANSRFNSTLSSSAAQRNQVNRDQTIGTKEICPSHQGKDRITDQTPLKGTITTKTETTIDPGRDPGQDDERIEGRPGGSEQRLNKR